MILPLLLLVIGVLLVAWLIAPENPALPDRPTPAERAARAERERIQREITGTGEKQLGQD